MNTKTFTTKCSILALMMLLLSQGVYAQSKEGNNWYFGDGGRMTWNTTRTVTANGKTLTGMPTPITQAPAMSTQIEGVFCMSDINGSPLFYSNGMTIWNRNHQVMQNGSDLFGHNSSAQSGIVIPYPGQYGKYITVSASLNPNNPAFPGTIGDRVAYSVIDMNLDGGLGGVVAGEKNILLTGANGVLGESVSAVRHSNGIDIWVVAVGKGTGANSSLNVWRATPSGVNPVRHGSYPLATNTSPNTEANGYLRFSPDGKSWAWTENRIGTSTPCNMVHFGEFNTSTGAFSNTKVMDSGVEAYGVEFSPNSELLYIAKLGPGCLVHAYKFADLLAASNPPTSVARKVHEMSSVGFTLGALQLGPDGRIYGVLQYSANLVVIDNTDNFDNATIHLVSGSMSGQGRLGLPNFLPHIFMAIPVGGSIGSNQMICSGASPAQLTSVAAASCSGEAITYLWEQSTNGGTSWGTATGGTTNQATFQPSALTATTYYRRRATSASCGTIYSNVVTITVTSAAGGCAK